MAPPVQRKPRLAQPPPPPPPPTPPPPPPSPTPLERRAACAAGSATVRRLCAPGLCHSLALTTDGAVWSWGVGSYGKLGHGDLQGQLLPKKVEAFAGQRVVAVSAGSQHSLAIPADGAVWSWGWGVCGLLGHGNEQNQLLPKKVEAFDGQRVVAVSAGGLHSLALTADDAVWSWGLGHSGRLGHGNQQHQLLPKKVEALAGRRVVAVSVGGTHCLAVTADGAVWSWGSGSNGMLGHGDQQEPGAAEEDRGFGWPARRRRVGWRGSLPRHHRRRRCLELGQWSLGHAGPRRPAGPAAAQEGQRLGGAARRHCVGRTPPQPRCAADGAVFAWGEGESAAA